MLYYTMVWMRGDVGTKWEENGEGEILSGHIAWGKIIFNKKGIRIRVGKDA